MPEPRAGGLIQIKLSKIGGRRPLCFARGLDGEDTFCPKCVTRSVPALRELGIRLRKAKDNPNWFAHRAFFDSHVIPAKARSLHPVEVRHAHHEM